MIPLLGGSRRCGSEKEGPHSGNRTWPFPRKKKKREEVVREGQKDSLKTFLDQGLLGLQLCTPLRRMKEKKSRCPEHGGQGGNQSG